MLSDNSNSLRMKLKLTISSFLLLVLLSCKNYYNDMISWADNIPVGTPADSVKKYQPNFIVIDWDNPDKSDSSKSFTIIKVKGNSDVLNMSNTLNFINDRYIGRFARK